MKAFTFWSDDAIIREIDIVFHSPIPYDELKKRAVNVDLKGVIVPTISIQDLIVMKTQSGRRQDLSDSKHLRSLLDK